MAPSLTLPVLQQEDTRGMCNVRIVEECKSVWGEPERVHVQSVDRIIMIMMGSSSELQCE